MLTKPYTRPPKPATVRPTRWREPARIGDECSPIPKTVRIEHEGYRRLVAALPCAVCGIVGYSQCAHVPPSGKGIKEDDRETFPACCDRPGTVGCHVKVDQYKLAGAAVTRQMARGWAADARRRIRAAGNWPADLEWME